MCVFVCVCLYGVQTEFKAPLRITAIICGFQRQVFKLLWKTKGKRERDGRRERERERTRENERERERGYKCKERERDGEGGEKGECT